MGLKSIVEDDSISSRRRLKSGWIESRSADGSQLSLIRKKTVCFKQPLTDNQWFKLGCPKPELFNLWGDGYERGLPSAIEIVLVIQSVASYSSRISFLSEVKDWEVVDSLNAVDIGSFLSTISWFASWIGSENCCVEGGTRIGSDFWVTLDFPWRLFLFWIYAFRFQMGVGLIFPNRFLISIKIFLPQIILDVYRQMRIFENGYMLF